LLRRGRSTRELLSSSSVDTAACVLLRCRLSLCELRPARHRSVAPHPLEPTHRSSSSSSPSLSRACTALRESQIVGNAQARALGNGEGPSPATVLRLASCTSSIERHRSPPRPLPEPRLSSRSRFASSTLLLLQPRRDHGFPHGAALRRRAGDGAGYEASHDLLVLFSSSTPRPILLRFLVFLLSSPTLSSSSTPRRSSSAPTSSSSRVPLLRPRPDHPLPRLAGSPRSPSPGASDSAAGSRRRPGRRRTSCRSTRSSSGPSGSCAYSSPSSAGST